MKNIFLAFSFWVLAFSLSQATITNDEILVTLILDTKGQNINALAGEVVAPDTLKPMGISDGNSIVNFWIEPLRFEGQRLIFSGMIPGGYNGATGKLFNFVLEGEQAELSRLKVKDLIALLNDGQGTKTAVRVTWQARPFESSGERIDIIAPEPFQPLIGRTPDLFGNQWFVSFAAQDKQSGIDHYEVAESRLSFNFLHRLNWIKTISPYQLLDQTGRSNIFVRAVDREGNVRSAKLIRSSWYKSVWFWIIIIIFLCGIFLGQQFWRSRRS